MRLLRHIISTLALCAVFCVPSHADSPALNRLASHLAGMPVTVQCYRDGEVPQGDTRSPAGWVILGTPIIHLQGSDCGALQNALTPSPRTRRWLQTFDGDIAVGFAFMALTHEAMHLKLASADEGQVECTAYRNAWPLLGILHLDWRVREQAYAGVRDRHNLLPTTGDDAVYRSVC